MLTRCARLYLFQTMGTNWHARNVTVRNSSHINPATQCCCCAPHPSCTMLHHCAATTMDAPPKTETCSSQTTKTIPCHTLAGTSTLSTLIVCWLILEQGSLFVCIDHVRCGHQSQLSITYYFLYEERGSVLTIEATTTVCILFPPLVVK